MKSPTFDIDRLGGISIFHSLIDEILRCGEIAMAIYRRQDDLKVTQKPDRSPVTEADHRVESELRAFIHKHFHECSFFGEETGESKQISPLRFVVDPIDGTRAFMRGIPTWSILVSLEENHIPVVGIAYMPAANDLFVAIQGQGALYNGRPCRVSAVENLQDAAISHGGLGQFTDTKSMPILSEIAHQAYTCRGFADFDGYKNVLLGRCDAMIDPGVQPYDISAAALLIREAGGRLTDLTGNETVYGGSGLASNGLIHAQLLQITSGEVAINQKKP